MEKFLFSENRLIWQQNPAKQGEKPEEQVQPAEEKPQEEQQKPAALSEQQKQIVEQTKPELITVRSEAEAREVFYNTVITNVPENLKAGFDDYFRKNVYVPGKGWEKQKEEWQKAVAEEIKGAKNLDEVFGANGSPGSFETWLKEKYPRMIGMWEAREKIREEKGGTKRTLEEEMKEEKEWLDANLKADSSLQKSEFEGLKRKALDIQARLQFPIEREKTGGVEGVKEEIKNLKQALADALLLQGILDNHENKIRSLAIEKAKTQMTAELSGIKEELKNASDANAVALLAEKAEQTADKLKAWNEIAEIQGVSEDEKTRVINEENDPNVIKSRLAGIKDRIMRERSIAGGEPGWGDELIGFINKYVTDPSKKKIIYGIVMGIAGLLGSIPFFGKAWRRSFISNTGLAGAAEMTGKTNLLNEANAEMNTTHVFIRAGIKKQSISNMLDMKVASFYSANPASLTKDPTEVPAFERLKSWMRNNGLANDDKRALAIAIGSMGSNFKIESAEEPLQEKPKEETKKPEDSLSEFYKKQNLTQDEIAKLEVLSAKKLASGEVKLEGFSDDKSKKISALLEKYKAKDETDPEKKFKDFIIAAVTKDPKSITEI